MFFIFFLLLFCSNPNPSKETPIYLETYTVEPYLKFKLGPQVFEDLISLVPFKHKDLDLYESGKLIGTKTQGSIVIAHEFESLEPISLKFKTIHNVHYPIDSSSFLLLSAAHQLEKIIARFQTIIISSDFNPQNFLNWIRPLRVIYDSRIEFRDPHFVSATYIQSNAAYLGGQKSMLLYKPTANESVPLSANAQVLAHEFFHGVFEYSFFDQKFDENGSLENSDAIHGINEGLADFFSYLITGEPNILGKSFSLNYYQKWRNFSSLAFKFADIASSVCPTGFYCYGTLLAHSLWASLKNSSLETKANKFTIFFSKLFSIKDQFKDFLVGDLQGQFQKIWSLLIPTLPADFSHDLCPYLADDFSISLPCQ